MKLSVISPTLNEAENVPRLVEELSLALRDLDYEILIVDDNSPDLTWSVAQSIASTNPRVRTLRRMQNPGLGLAVMDGFSAAQGDIIACIDADLQHDPSILSKMLEEFDKGADVVIGSRHVEGGGTGDWDRLRRVQSWFATRIAQFLLGIRLKDPMSGYFLVSRKNFNGIKQDLNGSGFKILLEILANLRAAQVTEVPYIFRSRTKGESKLSNKVILQFFHQVWRLCSSSRHFSVRFLKSAVVGGIGVFINLAVMALLLKLTNIFDWRASAIASLAANVQNYVLQNVWTYVAGASKDFRKLEGYFSYLLRSAAGMVVATVSYAGLGWTLARTPLMMHPGSAPAIFFGRLSCQFIAVLFGVGFNGVVNKVFTRTEAVRLNLESPQTSSNSTLIGRTEEEPCKSVPNLAPEIGK
jgi:dolichol-phosphate mannosyltransferase